MASYEYDSQNDELNRIAGGTLYADCPIGSYIPFGGTAIPTGWLLCNGQAVSRTDYADLFAVIGTAYGSGDGSTTFNIPDLREAVPKGAGLTSKSNNHLDADGLAVGEFIDDRIQDHSHKTGSGTSGAVITLQSLGASNIEDFGTSQKGMVSSSYRTGATTEVKSVGSNYIIKAKQIGVPADFAPVDTVASGNMKAVTSNAVYNMAEKITDYTVGSGYTFTGTVVKVGKIVFIDGKVVNSINNNTGNILSNIPANKSGMNKDQNVWWLSSNWTSIAGYSVLSFDNNSRDLSIGINAAPVGSTQVSFSYLTD